MKCSPEFTGECLAMSALLITTMIGGAPTTQEYADSIGADGYTVDAQSAVDKAEALLGV